MDPKFRKVGCCERTSGTEWKFRYLFSPLGKLADRAIYFANAFSLFYIFKGRFSSTCFSESNRPIFTKISGLVEGWKNLLSWYIILRSLKVCCHGNQLKSQNRRFCGPFFIIALPFWKRQQYCNSDFKRLNCMSSSALGRILVRFDSVTPEFTVLKKTSFTMIRQKSTYDAKYFDISWTELYLLYRFGRHMGWNGYHGIRLVVKRSCYGNQLNLRDVLRHRQERPVLSASAFNNGSDDHEAAFKRLNGSNPATSCTNLVNFRPIISEFKLLKRAFFCRDSAVI